MPALPRRRWTGWILLLVLIGPCLVIQAPREIGRWELAAALNAREAGRRDESYQLLEDAAQWFPGNLQLLLQKADWLTEDRRHEDAAAEWDRILQLPIDDVQTLIVHSQLLQNAGRFAEAVKDWRRLDQLSERSGRPGRAEALNGLAYAQALARTDLDEALDNVTKALELANGKIAFTGAASDTRGFLFYLQGRYDLALVDLNVCVPVTGLVGAGIDFEW